MNRRAFLVQSAAFALASAAPALAFAQSGRRAAFQPTRFSVQVVGSGPDVLLVPGLASGRHVWRRAVAAVPGYRYHLLQVAGFAGDPARGNSDGPVVAPLVEEIARYVEASGIGRAAVIGHSMGGTLGMMLAARRPELVERLMVVDMTPQPASLYGGAMGSQLARGLQSMVSSREGRQLLSSIISAFTPPAAGDGRSDSDVVTRAMHDLGTIDLTGDLPRIRAPLTILYASPSSESRGSIERSFTTAYAAARRARLVRIDDSGHMIMADQPDRFAREMRDFLR
ncbi:MAG: alpha/beta hydrolase [Alphaproteobacteria bacterium]|jgi:pimeloyl-ACP methyl ester carboxylesterase|nr:alpha/beta hydrolase [Alphaproteobacteria bacterium]